MSNWIMQFKPMLFKGQLYLQFVFYLLSLCLSLVIKSYPTLVTPWTVDCQPPLSMGFSRQKYWSGLPFLFPEDLPDPGIEPRSALQADSLPNELNSNL